MKYDFREKHKHNSGIRDTNMLLLVSYNMRFSVQAPCSIFIFKLTKPTTPFGDR
jgi:hypothetical protein